MMKQHILRCLIVLLALLVAEVAHAAQKAALVIGNGAYSSVTPLVNPANDANDMAAALGRIGYAVTLVKDGDLSAMENGLRAFLRDADHADSVVVFYSGHGVQVKGRNYLIPVTAKISDELDLDTQALSLDKLLELVDSAAPKVKIVILDSCRDNPLMRMLTRGGGTRGLARIDLDSSSAKGTLIAFSTAPGSVAQDGSGRNSPFTTALLAHMETPGLDIRQMFGQVRADVDQSTQGGQTPWVNEAIIGSFAMSGTAETPQPVKSITVEPRPVPAPANLPSSAAQPSPPSTEASNSPISPQVESYANELTDFGVEPTTVPHAPVSGPTPTTIPVAKVVTTAELRSVYYSPNAWQIIAIDVLDGALHQTISGSYSMPGAGNPGQIGDFIQKSFSVYLNKLTNGNKNRTIIVFCLSPYCWESYNAALRASAAGYSQVYWYRGGLEAWKAAGLPFSQPRAVISLNR